MNDTKIKIFQIYYRPEQIAQLDPQFTPFDNSGVEDRALEFGVFKRLHIAPVTAALDYWGAFSWKFGQKTALKGAEILAIISENPGYDAYYSNYSPEIECLFQNLWFHGQTTHPGFIQISQAVLAKAGIDPAICLQVEPSENFATANYFVASPRFWKSYITFVDRIMEPALKDSELRELLLSNRADPKSIHAGACYIPFIIERLFSVFIQTDEGRQFRLKKYSAATKDHLTPHHQLLHQMKEAAVKSRSNWLLTCWYGYRNLFLESSRGKEWAREHLADITPDQIKFAAPSNL